MNKTNHNYIKNNDNLSKNEKDWSFGNKKRLTKAVLYRISATVLTFVISFLYFGKYKRSAIFTLIMIIASTTNYYLFESAFELLT